MVGDAGALVELAELVVVALYGGLAVGTLVRWWRQRDVATAWAVAVFTVLAGVVGTTVLRADRSDQATDLVDRVVLAAFFLVPYLLFRVTAALRSPSSRVRVGVAALAAVAVLPVFVLDLPTGDETSAAATVHTTYVLLYWISLSALVVSWMWRGGAGRAWVVRARMRTLAVAVSLLAVASLLLGVASSDDPGPVEVVTVALALVAGPLFLFGLVPPGSLLARWGRAEERALRDAEAALVAATSPTEVAEALLPFVARALGGNVAVLTDEDGSVRAAHGVSAEEAARLVPAEAADTHDGARFVTSIDMRSGRLHVVGDPYTPFFGRDHHDVLTRLAELTDIALRRAHVTEAERRSAAEVERAHDAMREFVSIASHDLRSPITVVQGYAQLLVATWETADDATKLEHIETIGRQARHLARLTDDLLTTSRIDAGALQPDLRVLDLGALVDRVVRDLGLHVDADVAPATHVVADEDDATRILGNLLENATRYGAPPVEVSARRTEDRVELRVRDHGSGVPPEFVPRLFDRFARAGTSAGDEPTKGTGLGLAIVQGLARAAGGDVRHEPASPGAAFVVTFRPG